MKILYIAPERRSAEAAASALRRIAQNVTLTWAQSAGTALGWLRDHPDALAIIVDAEAQDARGDAFLLQVRRLGLDTPLAVIAPEHLERLLGGFTTGYQDLEATRQRLIDEHARDRAALARTNKICTALQERLFELEESIRGSEERRAAEAAEIERRAARESELAAQLADAIAARTAAENHQAELRTKLSQFTDRLSAAENDRQRTEARHAMRLGSLNNDLVAMRTRHDEAVAQNAAAERRLRELSAALDDAQAGNAEMLASSARLAAREAELNAALTAATAARTAAERQLADVTASHQHALQRWESERRSADVHRAREVQSLTARLSALQAEHAAAAARSAELGTRLEAEQESRTTLTERLSAAERALQHAEIDHAREVQTLTARLTQLEAQHDRALAQTASVERQLAEATASHRTVQEQWHTERAAAMDLAAELESRLDAEVDARLTLEDRLSAADRARRQVEAEHAQTIESLTTRLTGLQGRHDAAIDRTKSVERQLEEAIASHETERRELDSQHAAASEQSARRESELQAALAEQAGARAAAEQRLAESQVSHRDAQEDLRSQLAEAMRRATEFESRLAAEVDARTAAEDRLSSAERLFQHAEVDHAREVQSLTTRLAQLESQHDRVLAQSALVEQQLTDAVASHQASRQTWDSERAALAEQSSHLASQLRAALAEEEAARIAAEQKLDEAEASHQHARDELHAQLAAADRDRQLGEEEHASEVQSLTTRFAQLEAQHDSALAHAASIERQLADAVATHQTVQQELQSQLTAATARWTESQERLAVEIDTRIALEERLSGADRALQQAGIDHAREVQSLTVRLTELESQHDRALAHTASLERQAADAIASYQTAQQEWEAERVAAAGRSARRESELGTALAEEAAARIAVEQRLVEIEASYEHARQEWQSRLNAAEAQSSELRSLLSLETDARTKLEQDVSAAQQALQRDEADHANAIDALNTALADFRSRHGEAVERLAATERQLADALASHAQAQDALQAQLAAERLDRHNSDERHADRIASLTGRLADLQSLHDAMLLERDRDIARLQQDRDGLHRKLAAMRAHASSLRQDAERAATLQLQLAQTQKEIRRQFERAPYGLFECTPDGGIVRLNHVLARMLNYRGSVELRRDEFVAASFESAADLQWLLQRAEPSGNLLTVETTLKTRDRRRLFVRLHALTSGRSVLIAVEDLTRVSTLEHRIREAQRMEAVGRVASEVAVTCDTLLRDVTQGGQRWLAGFGSDAPLRQQGELLLGDVTRAAGLLRQFAVYGHTQITNVEPVSLPRVLRDMKPVLERILGDEIALTLPKTTRPFDVDVEAARVERILVNVANYARERMPQGGHVRIQLATTVVDQQFLARHPKVRPGAHVLLTISELKGATRPTLPVQWPAADRPQASEAPMEKPGMDLGPLMMLISDLGGHLWMAVEPGGNATLQIRLPARTQHEAIESATPNPLAHRGRQLTRWFRH